MTETQPVSVANPPQPPPTRDSPEVALAGAVAMFAAMVVVLFFARVTDSDMLNAFIAVAIALACHMLATWVARRIVRRVRA